MRSPVGRDGDGGCTDGGTPLLHHADGTGQRLSRDERLITLHIEQDIEGRVLGA